MVKIFFFQQLILRHPFYDEQDLLGGFTNYRDHFSSKFPDEIHRIDYIQQQNHIDQHHSVYNAVLDDILSSYSFHDTLTTYIQMQFRHIYRTRPSYIHSLPTAINNLSSSQYIAWNMVTHGAPLLFITGAAGTGKSYLINALKLYFSTRNRRYLLVAPTGVAAQNVDGLTFHSVFRIKPSTTCSADVHSLLERDREQVAVIRNTDTIIIDEVSMLSSHLLSWLSTTLCRLMDTNRLFGGKQIVLIGDLYQLPPVNAPFIFHAPEWRSFRPIFLDKCFRQADDPSFIHILHEVRTGTISPPTWQILRNINSKAYSLPDLTTSTHLLSLRSMVENLNNTALDVIPGSSPCYTISAIDTLDNERIQAQQNMFRQFTNLPYILQLRVGARVMYLQNTNFHLGICNGSIGIVTDIDLDTDTQPKTVIVQFLCGDSLLSLSVPKQTVYFNHHGCPASRCQFPLSVAYALTVHKAQGLTLQHVSLYLDDSIFEPGQAYVALSRARRLQDISILSLNRSAFQNNPQVTEEYNYLVSLPVLPRW
jgi:ATP-dependent DNA helicase PIF1